MLTTPDPIPIYCVKDLVVLDQAGRRWPWRAYWARLRALVAAQGAPVNPTAQ